MINQILSVWPIVLALAGIALWAIRLEARAISNSKDIARVESDCKSGLDRVEETAKVGRDFAIETRPKLDETKRQLTSLFEWRNKVGK